MSWFITLIPKNSQLEEQEVTKYSARLQKVIPADYRLKIVTPHILLYGGGLPETFHFKNSEPSGPVQGWLTCGIGIKLIEDSPSFVHEGDWDALIRAKLTKGEARNIDGHFVVAIWKPRYFEILTDSLGLRSAYVATTDHYILVSTRLDFITPFLESPELSLESLASGWTLINSFADDSFIRNVQRVGPSGRVLIENGMVKSTWEHWTPNAKSRLSVIPALRNLTLLPLRDGKRLTLGLSGGVDSRTLLAFMTNEDKSQWQVHSVGDTSNADIPVAKEIAQRLRAHHQVLLHDFAPETKVDVLADSLRQYSLQSEMSDSPFGFPRLALFSDMRMSGYWMIDGGYGELLRRSYGNKLVVAAHRALKTQDIRPLLRHLHMPKSRIFTEEVWRSLLKHTELQLESAVRAMPKDVGEENIGNWIDLFHIRYRLKNYAGASQGLYDYYIPNYMPFALSTMISAYFSIPSSERANNRINRKIIASSGRILRTVPLIASGAPVPYWTSRSTLASRALGKLRRAVGTTPQERGESFRVKVMLYLRDFLLDRISSSGVKQFPYYDHHFILAHLNAFLSSPNESDAEIVEDWLSFDFWRENLSKS